MICHQFPPGSFPVISILVFAGMIPSTVPAVDGSARTLIWVEVIPSTGETIGWGEGESGGSDGTSVIVADSVDVMTGEEWVGVVSPWTAEAQLVLRIRIKMTIREKRMDTAEFYRLSHAYRKPISFGCAEFRLCGNFCEGYPKPGPIPWQSLQNLNYLAGIE